MKKVHKKWKIVCLILITIILIIGVVPVVELYAGSTNRVNIVDNCIGNQKVLDPLPDSTAPSIKINLQREPEQKRYHGENVYTGTIAFSVAIEDPEVSSGISNIIITLKNKRGDVLEKYTAESEIWTSIEEIKEIRNLAEAEHPTEEQIIAANTCRDQEGLKAKLEGLLDGYYLLAATAIDKEGNKSPESVIGFIKDSEPPKVKLDNQLVFQKERTENNLYTGGIWKIEVKDLTLTTEVEKLLSGLSGVADAMENWDIETDEKNGMTTYSIELRFGKEEFYKEGYYSGFYVNAVDALNGKNTKSSSAFIIDYTAPKYRLTAISSVDENAYTGDQQKAYYKEAITTEILIHEETTYDPEIFTIVVKNTPGAPSGTSEEVIKWEHGTICTSNENYQLEYQADIKTFRLKIDNVPENDNDGYVFEIFGQDEAGNVLEPASIKDQQELKKVRVMDTTAPVLQNIIYDRELYTVGTKDYANAPVGMTFILQERNPMDSRVEMAGVEKERGWSNKKTDTYETTLDVSMFGEKGEEQTIAIEIIDRAGNRAVLGENILLRSSVNTSFENGKFQDRFTIDTIAPIIFLEYESVRPDRDNVSGIDYFKQPVTVKITVDEHNFEEQLFNDLIESAGEEQEYVETPWKTEGDIHVKTLSYCGDQQYDLTVSGKDNAQNPIRLQKTTDQISATQSAEKVFLKTAVDTTLPVSGDQENQIVVVAPLISWGSTMDAQELYHTDVIYEVMVYDPMENQYASGIDHIVFQAQGADGTSATAKMNRDGKITAEEGLEIQMISGEVSNLAKSQKNAYIFRVKIEKDSFNTNGITLLINVEDLATNTKEISTKPVAIDVTNPEITIEYDNNDVKNKKYFSEQRIATIRVRERNFTDQCFRFRVNGSDKELNFQPVTKGSGNGDDTVWICTYPFEIDGDYVIECAGQDLAGNTAAISYAGEAGKDFTIDRIKPKIRVTYDNQDALNEKYYKEARMAEIVIEERNFFSEDVSISMNAENNGEKLQVPPISQWIDDGDVHRATIKFDYDAEFTFDLEFMDLAENRADAYTEDVFVVDLTAPEIAFFSIQHKSANNNVVAPGIRYSDTNYDRNGIDVELTGDRNGQVEMDSLRNISANGMEIRFVDMEHIPEKDDMYTMSAIAVDLAGNRSEASVCFSVNRFGSAYTLDEKTRALVNDYYAKQEQEVVIYETNVDTLELQEIMLNLNGKLKTLDKGKDFLVLQSGSEESWKQYAYHIKKENFSEEGVYNLTLYSEDRASNRSDNHSKGEKIEFVIDKTEPSILIAGIEDKGQYREESKEVTIDVQDNICIEKIEILFNDRVTTYSGQELAEANGKVSLTLESDNDWQTMQVIAYDAAKNQTESEKLTFLISTNLFVQFCMNKPLFYTSIGAVLVMGGSILLLTGRKTERRKLKSS